MTLLDSIHNGPTSQKKLVNAVIALLVSNFYFKLDFLLVLEHSVYHYQGSIWCYADCHAVINILKQQYIQEIRYITHKEITTEYGLEKDICSVCY
jgi:hypothetical protein